MGVMVAHHLEVLYCGFTRVDQITSIDVFPKHQSTVGNVVTEFVGGAAPVRVMALRNQAQRMGCCDIDGDACSIVVSKIALAPPAPGTHGQSRQVNGGDQN